MLSVYDSSPRFVFQYVLFTYNSHPIVYTQARKGAEERNSLRTSPVFIFVRDLSFGQKMLYVIFSALRIAVSAPSGWLSDHV